MKKMVLAALLVVLGLGLLNPSYGETFITIKGEDWESSLSGYLKADTPLISGTSLDLKTLNLDKTAFIPELSLSLKLGMNKFIGSYSTASYEGSTTLANSFNFGGITYNAATAVKSKLNLTMGSLLYERLFLPDFIAHAFPSVGEAQMGLLLGVKYLSADASLTSALAAKKESGAAPLPVIGLNLQMGVLNNKLNFQAGAVGLQATISGVTAEYFDAYFETRIYALPTLPIGIGYRTNRFSVKDTSKNAFDVNLGMNGPYLFASLDF